MFLYEEDWSRRSALAIFTGKKIPPNSVFVGHSYIQQAAPGRKRNHALRYHINMKPVDYNLKDAVVFAYENSPEQEGFEKVHKEAKSTLVAYHEMSNNG